MKAILWVSVIIVFGVTAIAATMPPNLAFTPQDQTTPTPNVIYSKIGQIQASNAVNLLAWNSKNNLLAFAEITDSTPRIEVWNAGTFELEDSLDPQGLFRGNIVSSLKWSPDSILLAIAYDDYDIDFINLWNIVTDEFSAINGTGRISSLDWSPDGQRLAMANGNDPQKSLSIWNVSEKRLLSNFEYLPLEIAFTAWHPTQEKLATATWGGSIQVWDTLTYSLVSTMPVSEQELPPMWILEWNSDGSQLAGARCKLINGDCYLWLWDTASGNVTNPFAETSTGFSYLKTLDWNPQGNLLLGNDGAYAMIWNTVTGDLVDTFQMNDAITSVSWNSEGTQFAMASSSGLVEIWAAQQ